MYKLMIVDDDELLRERIAKAIPMEALGLELCGEAENGIQALELFERSRPQIVIMDINIPLLNGIDTAKKILQEDDDVNIIIITGYGTVDFAQEAIRNGMVDFMLKPVDEQELEVVLKNIVAKLQQKSAEALEKQRMERLLERGMPLLRNKYFLSLMQTPAETITEEECQQYLRDFQITDAINEICVAIIIPTYKGMNMDKQMSSHAVLEDELTSSLHAVQIGSIILYDSMQRTLLVTYSAKKNLSLEVMQRLSIIRDKMRYLYRLDFRASVGTSVTGFRYLQKSYRSAEQALSYWSVAEDNNIVSSESIQNMDMPAMQVPVLRYADIMDILATKDSKQLWNTIDKYLRAVSYETRNSVYIMQQRTVELVSLLLLCAREQGGNVDVLLDEKPIIYIRLFQAASIHDIMLLVQAFAEKLVECVHNQRESTKNRALANAKQFILQNYADPELSLGKVAEHVRLSTCYVSSLFKRTDDRTFTEYLNHIRVENAKKLLASTNMRAYEVADAVGYQSSKYFFQMFKQITGITPREYYEIAHREQDTDK